MDFDRRRLSGSSRLAHMPRALRARIAAFAATCIATLLLVNPVHARADSPQAFYAAPAGSGSTCSLSAPCSLTGAQAKVRTLTPTMQGDITVYLRGGTYQLAATFTLTPLDSGHNYNVIYTAFPGETPVLSGGTTVMGWQSVGNGIYKTNVGTDSTLDNARQFYVNGVRAQRAQGLVTESKTWTKISYYTGANGPWTGIFDTVDPATGLSSTPDMSSWDFGHPDQLELVGVDSFRAFRCPVQGISGTGGRYITVAEPCWGNTQVQAQYLPQKGKGATFNQVARVENAYELLDTPGEWYLNRANGDLYYMPRSQELAGFQNGTVQTVLPRLETLMMGAGTLDPDTPVHNISIRGLTFSYSGWTQPNSKIGYAGLVAGMFLTDDPAPYPGCPSASAGTCVHPPCNPNCVSGFPNAYTGPMTELPYGQMPAAVEFQSSYSVSFIRNTFVHLGAIGLWFDKGYQPKNGPSPTGGGILGNVFYDISGGALVIGNQLPVKETDPMTGTTQYNLDSRETMANYSVQDNYVHGTAVEYFDSAGIFATFVDNLNILHDDVEDLPQGGIDVGFVPKAGLVKGLTTEAENVHINNNYIAHVAQGGFESAGIYVVDTIPGSVVSGNYLNGIGNTMTPPPDADGTAGRVLLTGIYMDLSTEHFQVGNNVVHDVSAHTWPGAERPCPPGSPAGMVCYYAYPTQAFWITLHIVEQNRITSNYSDNSVDPSLATSAFCPLVPLHQMTGYNAPQYEDNLQSCPDNVYEPPVVGNPNNVEAPIIANAGLEPAYVDIK